MCEETLVPISAIEHFSYCPRQCALIHVERCYEENLFTLRGMAVHEKVHEEGSETDQLIRVEYALPVYSTKYGLVGQCDVVEFSDEGIPYPVEYKHGPRRAKEHDELQLAAQAICLEEMLNVSVPKGAIYHHSSRRRREVLIGVELRARALSAAEEVRKMISQNTVPEAIFDSRCKNCSLIDLCQPQAVTARLNVQDALKRLYET